MRIIDLDLFDQTVLMHKNRGSVKYTNRLILLHTAHVVHAWTLTRSPSQHHTIVVSQLSS